VHLVRHVHCTIVSMTSDAASVNSLLLLSLRAPGSDGCDSRQVLPTVQPVRHNIDLRLQQLDSVELCGTAPCLWVGCSGCDGALPMTAHSTVQTDAAYSAHRYGVTLRLSATSILCTPQRAFKEARHYTLSHATHSEQPYATAHVLLSSEVTPCMSTQQAAASW
jgi:hypothetical protein